MTNDKIGNKEWILRLNETLVPKNLNKSPNLTSGDEANALRAAA